MSLHYDELEGVDMGEDQPKPAKDPDQNVWDYLDGDQPKSEIRRGEPASGLRTLDEHYAKMYGNKPASGEEVLIVNGKPIKVKDIIDKMEDEYRERHGLPDPEE